MTPDNARKKIRRFYTEVSVQRIDEEFAVLLDGREIRTPSRAAVRFAAEDLASAVAEEWTEQDEHIVPDDMPMTQLAFTAVDRVKENRGDIQTTIASYIETDLLSHRVETPEDLAQRQVGEWQPYVDWFENEFNVDVPVTTSLLGNSSNPNGVAAVNAALAGMDVESLAAVSVMTQTMGSIVLAMAVERGFASAVDAAAASQLDERYQQERWGEDREDVARLQSLTMDVISAARFLSLHRSI